VKFVNARGNAGSVGKFAFWMAKLAFDGMLSLASRYWFVATALALCWYGRTVIARPSTAILLA
jgi:hypothetical protein